MGDTSINVHEDIKDPICTKSKHDDSRILPKVGDSKLSENVTNIILPDVPSTIQETSFTENVEIPKVETVFKIVTSNHDIEKETETKVEKEKIQEKKIRASSAINTHSSNEKIIRNQSDIFSLKAQSGQMSSTIFSVSGTPSRRVFARKDTTCAVSPIATSSSAANNNNEPPSEKPATLKICEKSSSEIRRPASAFRNPLTGTGVTSNDEYKCTKMSKKKDGNPLLGLGYTNDTTPSPSQRVPPGGYSNGLW